MKRKIAFGFLPLLMILSLWFTACFFTIDGSWSAFGTTLFVGSRDGSIQVTGSKWRDGRNYAPDFGFTRYSPPPDPGENVDPFSTEIWHPGIAEILRGKILAEHVAEGSRSYVTLHLPYWLLTLVASLFGFTFGAVALSQIRQPNKSGMDKPIPFRVD